MLNNPPIISRIPPSTNVIPDRCLKKQLREDQISEIMTKSMIIKITVRCKEIMRILKIFLLINLTPHNFD